MKKFNPEKTLFLIDGSSFLYRAYYGLRPLHTIHGEQVQAVYGFVRMIKKLIDRFNPTYMALTWDSPGKTTRHETFAEYKATREAPPNDLFAQKDHITRFADLIGLEQVALPGVEADDIMYTMAQDAKKQGYDVVLVTSDKDLGQMLDEQTYMYDTFKDVLLDVAAFEEKMGFPVSKLPFYFALLGDASDNIPGVRGIGKKGAQELVNQFASLEDVYAHLDQVPKKRMRTALEANKDNAFLSRELFLLQYHPLDVTVQKCTFDPADWQKARPLFAELNFKSLLKDVGSSGANPGSFQQSILDQPQQPKAQPLPYTFKKVTTEQSLQDMIDQIKQVGSFALDTETTGMRPLEDPIVGLSIATQKGSAWYVPFGHHVEEHQLSKKRVLEALKPVFEDEHIKKYLHHAAFDVAVLWSAGAIVQGVAFDTMLAAKLTNASWQRAGLKALSERYLHEKMLSFADVVTARKLKNFSQVPLDPATQYAAADAHQTLQLVPILQKELKEQGLEQLYYTVEQPLQQILVAMEQEGVDVDVQLLKTLGSKVQRHLIELEDEIITLSGEQYAGINLNSPKQVQKLLFEDLGLPPQKKSAKGAYSTDSEVLRTLAKIHPVPGYIAKYREMAKLKNTYIDALPGYINPTTGKIHTSFSQTAVATGRLSSSYPNLQNIPAAHGYGIEIRQAFKPKAGRQFVSADYSQIELRVMAYLSQDKQLIDAFLRGADIHTQTAAKLFDVLPDNVTHEQRQIGKRINFSVLYGMTPYGLSKDLAISYADAKQYIQTYFEQYPEVQEWMDQVVEQTKEQGFVTTIAGRKRDIPGIYESNRGLYQEAVRVAVNTAVQGSAADIMKMGMIQLAERIKKDELPADIVLQIHDELLLTVQSQYVDEVSAVTKEILERVVDWNVPLEVKTRAGADWKAVTK